jgi:hypothetical protein
LDTALVLASTSSPPLSLPGRFVDDQHLADELVLEFDVTHHLSKLSATWANLMASTTSFGELLPVTAFTFSLSFFLFDLVSRLPFYFSFLLSFFFYVRPFLVTSPASLAQVSSRRS